MDEFMKIRARFIAAYKEEAQMRIELRGGMDKSEAEVEDLVDETITVLLTTEKVKLEEPADKGE